MPPRSCVRSTSRKPSSNSISTAPSSQPVCRAHREGQHGYPEFWERLNRSEFQAAPHNRIAKGGKEVRIEASYNPLLERQDDVTFNMTTGGPARDREPADAIRGDNKCSSRRLTGFEGLGPRKSHGLLH